MPPRVSELNLKPTLFLQEPSTPYPTLVSADDQIHVYVDFTLIVSTTSSDDALGLLIAMYNVFELNFYKHSRAIRFLYSVFHRDKRFLSNAMRSLVKEKNIDVFTETSHQPLLCSNDFAHRSTTMNSTTNDNETISIKENGSVGKSSAYYLRDQTNTHSLQDNADSVGNRIISTEE